MQLTKECMTRLMALKTAGRRLQYQKAMTVLSETALGTEITQRFRPESRIPNCLKYDLQDGYRIVVQAIEGTGDYLGLFVGSHDEVDHFLNTHLGWIFDPKKHTLKELRLNTATEEMVNTVRSADLQAPSSRTPTEPPTPIFSRLSRSQLRTAGGPEEKLDQALSFTDPDHPSVLAFLDSLGERTGGILLSYLTGSKEERAEIAAYLDGDRVLLAAISEDQLAAVNTCSENFVDLRDVPEEKKAFESLAFEDWMIYLHPDQRSLVTKKFSGAARLRGVSGSGKTVVAIHRARTLAGELLGSGSRQEVLFLTFNRSLCDQVDGLIKRLATEQEAERITVSTISKWCQEYIRFRTDMPATWSEEANDKLWRAVLQSMVPALQQCGFFSSIDNVGVDLLRHRDAQFLRDELDYIFERFLHTEVGAYMSLERIGRGRPLGAHQRQAVLDLYHAFVAKHAEKHLFDPHELARVAYSLLCKGEPPQDSYVALIVDEVQDLSPMELRVVRILGGPSGEGLFLVGDGAQKIYGRGQSLKSIGIDVVGRSSVLRKNYRNTQEIFGAATALKTAYNVGRADDDPAATQIEPLSSASSGDRPLLMIARDPEHEWATIVREVRYLTNRLGLVPNQICCVARMQWMRRGLLEALERAGIKALDFRVDGNTASDAVLVSTLHNSKGHEFRAVFILGLYDGAIPLAFAHDEEEIEREAALLYVAMTGAKELLYLSYAVKDSQGKKLAPSKFSVPMTDRLDRMELA